MFIDESGVNQDMVRLYGRSEVGKRANGEKPCSRGTRTTIISGLNLSGMVGSFIFEGYLNLEILLIYLSEVLLPELKAGTVIFMDNLSAHKSPRVEELVNSWGCKVDYIPRYSPEFNPIELSWSKIKNYIRAKTPRTLQEVQITIGEAINLITISDSKNFFKHCGYFAN